MVSDGILDFVALSGLPRTGSTLLSAILSENPRIHAENHSAVCQLMWDMQQSCGTDFCRVNMAGARKQDVAHDLVANIPFMYYRDTIRPTVLDKCRSWTLPLNVELIRRYIRHDPKIIVMTRPAEEIVESFAQVYRQAGVPLDVDSLWEPDTEPITRPLAGVEWARANNSEEYFFIEYADLVSQTSDVLRSLYDFCGWEPFAHDLGNIRDRFAADDSAWGVMGLHSVRPTIAPLVRQ